MQWFVLNTFTGQESKVASALKDLKSAQIGKVAIPTVVETITKGSKKIEQKRKRYPGYAFAEIDLYRDFSKGELDKALFDAVNAIPGMIGFLGGNQPRPLTEDEVFSLKEDMKDGKKAKEQVEFAVGDEVKILDGAFANNIGTILKKNDDEQIAIVEFNVFGQDMNTEVAYGSLEKIEDEA